MPEELAQSAVALITYLLPGFVTAWIFYGFTSHPKPSQFERTVEAIIYTFLIQSTVPPIRWTMLKFGETIPLAPWTDAAEQSVTAVLAIALGVILAGTTNTDVMHLMVRRLKLTNRTSHPSEWFYVFSQNRTFVILHFKDGRRLYGWPKEWPTDPGKGQFYIMLPTWIAGENERIEAPELDGILVPATDIAWVEFIKKETSS